MHRIEGDWESRLEAVLRCAPIIEQPCQQGDVVPVDAVESTSMDRFPGCSSLDASTKAFGLNDSVALQLVVGAVNGIGDRSGAGLRWPRSP